MAIDWTKPIETVPDALNPAPVPCEFMEFDSDGDVLAAINGHWCAEDGYVTPNCLWCFHPQTGMSGLSSLPDLRNVVEPEHRTPQAIGSAVVTDPAWSSENEYADQSADVMIALDRDDLNLSDDTQRKIMEVIEPIIRGIWDAALEIGAQKGRDAS